MLDIWIDALGVAGVDEVLINLHHRSEAVLDYLEHRTGGPVTHAVYEPELLGSAGTLVANRDWVDGEELFLACYADSLTDFSLRKLVDAHRAGGTVATLTLFHAERPSACGIVEIDAEGLVVAFVEKPTEPPSDLANAGMYAFHPRVLDHIGGPPPKDIGYDLLPALVGRARAIAVDGYFRDIGTPEDYERAQREWRTRDAG